MDFEKKYPMTQRPNEYLVVQWTRGYKQVNVYFNDELIGSVQGAAKLLKGISLPSDLGTLTLKLSEKPVTLDVIVDGYHSRVNVSHPVKELKKTSTYFWIISAFALIAGGIDMGIFLEWSGVGTIVFSMNLIVFVLYILSAVFVGQGKPWGFYLGFAVFSFCTLIALLALMGGLVGGFILYIFMAVRIGGLVILIMNLKTANAAVRHLKYRDPVMEDLLDSKIRE
ncbi:hypothetical protein [Fluviicola chungangensis]|uniref:Uncharacterized protein n=1 Tax=Fluviicola chungangensis TaxID=2597671 RepID=A0A556N7E4_9FLAO|nr:hypothetical protein [Fluviicola chungangensis]TSJ47949.1 hypothetical protein FO442_02110 [Fluviicola chungangensis]